MLDIPSCTKLMERKSPMSQSNSSIVILIPSGEIGAKKRFSFHLLPSGLTNPTCMNVIGSGVVVSIKDFFSELAALEGKGLQNVRERILISDRCHVVLDLHQLVDGLEEAELQGKSLGTTRKGIGPTYQSKAARSGIRITDVFNKELFDSKLRILAAGLKKRFGDLLVYDPEEEIARYDGYRAQLGEFVADVVPLISDAQSKNVSWLIEGANALLLDVDYGTYPYVTSSNTGKVDTALFLMKFVDLVADILLS